MKLAKLSVFAVCCMLLPCSAVFAQMPAPTPAPASAPRADSAEHRAQMLKQWMQESQARLRAYEWIETTVVSKGGSPKSSSQKRCYYGADGKLVKLVLGASAASSPSGPLLPGRAASRQKAAAKDYLEAAGQLLQAYVPPMPAMLQQVIAKGGLAMAVVVPGKQIRISFSNYLKPGDSLAADIAIPHDQLLGLSVKSYLDGPDKPVNLQVQMTKLPDGTIAATHSVLGAPSIGLTVVVDNSGYRLLPR